MPTNGVPTNGSDGEEIQTVSARRLSWVSPDLARLLIGTVGAFANFAFLLAVVPLWAANGGATDFAAGLTTGVFMGVTVATQLVTPALLRRFGHRNLLAASAVLLGLPTPVYILSSGLAALLAVSAVRGIGFGLVTVTGSALVAHLVPTGRRGQGVGLYGMAVGLPNLVGLPAGVWVAQNVGFTPVFWAASIGGLLPLLILPRTRVQADPATATSDSIPATPSQLLMIWVGPWLKMSSAAIVAGGLVTFVPLAAERGELTAGTSLIPAALFGFSVTALLARWLTGFVSDRWGPGRVLTPALAAMAVGMLGYAAAVRGDSALVAATLVGAGAILVGFGYGAVQNETLVLMFGRAERLGAPVGAATSRSAEPSAPQRRHAGHDQASAAWNVAFDTGTGIGAIVLGLIIDQAGYSWGFSTAAAIMAACLLIRRPRRRSRSDRPSRLRRRVD